MYPSKKVYTNIYKPNKYIPYNKPRPGHAPGQLGIKMLKNVGKNNYIVSAKYMSAGNLFGINIIMPLIYLTATNVKFTKPIPNNLIIWACVKYENVNQTTKYIKALLLLNYRPAKPANKSR